MKRLALVLFLVGAWQSSRADSPMVASQYKDNFQQDACVAMTRAADFLVAVQKPAKSTKVGWSWRVNDGQVSKNVSGLAARALLSAYEVSNEQRYLDAALRYADGLVAAKGTWSVDNLPYKADVEFLADIAHTTGRSVYRDAALMAFHLVKKRSPAGSKEVSRIAAGRAKTPALLGFDTALGIRAALAVSDRTYAYEMADDVIGRMDDWYKPTKNTRYSLLSGAALVVALSELDLGHYKAVVERFRKDLVKFQQANGAWLSNETQPTAYAIMAMVDGTPYDRAVGLRGAHWFKSTMLEKGSYAVYNDYMPEPFVGQVISEVNAEALEALALVCGTD